MNSKRSFSSGLGALAALALVLPIPEAAAIGAPLAVGAAVARQGGTSGHAASGPQQVVVAGRVLDAAGAPAIGARIASFWTFDDKDPAGRPSQLVTTGDDGTFRGDVQLPAPGPFALLVYSADGGEAGLVRLATGADLGSLEVRLAPAVHVRGRIASPALGRPVRWTNAFWRLAGTELSVAGAASTEGKVDLRLPPGRYEWFAYGEELKSAAGTAQLAAGTGDGTAREHDLGTIEIEPTFLALNRGKELPAWHVTEARGVPLEEATLASFRGRWLLVAFFAHDSGPALFVELPQLMRFHDETRGTPRAERFRLVAFHDGSLPDLAALDRRIAPLVERVWDGRTIPFPLLIDATDATFEAYGIESLPTIVLVDPEGKLVGEASLAELVAALEGEEKAAGAGDGAPLPPREGR